MARGLLCSQSEPKSPAWAARPCRTDAPVPVCLQRAGCPPRAFRPRGCVPSSPTRPCGNWPPVHQTFGGPALLPTPFPLGPVGRGLPCPSAPRQLTWQTSRARFLHWLSHPAAGSVRSPSDIPVAIHIMSPLLDGTGRLAGPRHQAVPARAFAHADPAACRACPDVRLLVSFKRPLQ